MQHVPFFCAYPHKFESVQQELAIYAISNFERKFSIETSHARYRRVITDKECTLHWAQTKRHMKDLFYFVYDLCTELTSLSQSAKVSNELDPTRIDGIFTIEHLTITLCYVYNAPSSSMHIEVENHALSVQTDR